MKTNEAENNTEDIIQVELLITERRQFKIFKKKKPYSLAHETETS